MPEVPAADASAPWRKRHPVLARVLLYVGGLLVVGAAVFGLVSRAGIDRQDRLDYLDSLLDGMDLTLGSDPDGQRTLGILDEEYAAADLPPAIRQRALRVRAYAYVKGGRVDKAYEALDEALALVDEPRQRTAIAMERSQLLVNDGKPEEALQILDGVTATPDDAVLYVWHARSRANALAQAGREGEVLATLEGALDALPRPLPDQAPLYFANTLWTPREALFGTTVALTELSMFDPGPRPWTRLIELFPSDFEVAAQATRRLARAGHDAEASISWAHARSLDPAAADELKDRFPDLDRIDGIPLEGLKKREGDGR